MCTKGVFSSFFSSDVERGVPVTKDAVQLRPLLSGNANQNTAPSQRPPRPLASKPVLKVSIPDIDSQCSTPTPTPQTETAESAPRRWCRSDRRLRRLNTELLEAITGHDIEGVERLLQAGANPNATCRLALVSACHMAALSGGDAMALLLKFGAEKNRLDKLGRTPLHLATWAGNSRQVAIMLDFPEVYQKARN